MTSEAERRDETTTAKVTADAKPDVTPDVTPDMTPDMTADATPDATAEETGASAGETARAHRDAETADGDTKMAGGSAETMNVGAETATAAETTVDAAVQPPTPALEAVVALEAVASPVEPSPLSPLPTSPQQEGARIRDSLETIKTAVVWLIVIQILTILSPLLRVSLKWMLLVGLVLTLGSFAVGAVAYLKAQRAQRGLPE